jgi:hypothetical protein
MMKLGIFIPIKQSYNNNLKKILLWIHSKEEERKWANKVRLVGLFEIQWRLPVIIFWLNFWTIGNWILSTKKSKLWWHKSNKL